MLYAICQSKHTHVVSIQQCATQTPNNNWNRMENRKRVMPLYSKSAAIPLATAQLTVCLQNAAHAQLFIVRCNGQHGSAYFPHLTLPQTLHAHIHICIFIVCFDFISLFVCFLCFVSDICLFSFCLRSRAFFLTLY